MDANQVRAYAAAKWPSAMQSPVAEFCQSAAVKTHLAHCAAVPRLGRYFGLAFTASGAPAIVAIELHAHANRIDGWKLAELREAA